MSKVSIRGLVPIGRLPAGHFRTDEFFDPTGRNAGEIWLVISGVEKAAADRPAVA